MLPLACRPHTTSHTHLSFLVPSPVFCPVWVTLASTGPLVFFHIPRFSHVSEPSHILLALCLECSLLSASHKGLLLSGLSHFEMTFPWIHFSLKPCSLFYPLAITTIFFYMFHRNFHNLKWSVVCLLTVCFENPLRDKDQICIWDFRITLYVVPYNILLDPE